MARDKRLNEIVQTLSYYGVKFVYHNKVRPSRKSEDAVKLRLAFEKLGPSFIKIGQILSTRVDLLPAEFVKELAKLQDEVPEFPFAEVERIFFEETGLTLGEAFLEVEERPVASASIAQVHKAVLRSTGETVVLKVQRPVIGDLMLRDLDILIRLSRRLPKDLTSVVNPTEALQQIKESTRIELDFRNEARYIQRFKELNRNVVCVGVPKVYTGMTTRRILVEEYVEGIKINNTSELEAAGYDLEEISRKLMLAYLKQIFRDGFFHADPHPGNLIIREGKIYFIDFGIVGELSRNTSAALNELLSALAIKDIDLMVKVCLELGIPKGPVDKIKLYDHIEDLFDKYLSSNFLYVNLTDFITDFFQMFKYHNIAVPSDLTILEKALSILEGLFIELAPELNIAEIAQDYLQENLSVETYLSRLSKESLAIKSYKLLKEMSDVPGNLTLLLKQLVSGRMRLKIDVDDFDEKWVDLKKMSNRIVLALVIVGLLLSSSIMSGTEGGQYLGQGGFVISALFGFWLLLSIFRSGNL